MGKTTEPGREEVTWKAGLSAADAWLGREVEDTHVVVEAGSGCDLRGELSGLTTCRYVKVVPPGLVLRTREPGDPRPGDQLCSASGGGRCPRRSGTVVGLAESSRGDDSNLTVLVVPDVTSFVADDSLMEFVLMTMPSLVTGSSLIELDLTTMPFVCTSLGDPDR
mmetsp:Transcript_32279/g.92948  ORF Transcript_32279/g.92948 Transcript_32279/m.92948 type:complete len:165 (+) Transcript_32279:228-722(+)